MAPATVQVQIVQYIYTIMVCMYINNPRAVSNNKPTHTSYLVTSIDTYTFWNTLLRVHQPNKIYQNIIKLESICLIVNYFIRIIIDNVVLFFE